MADVFISYRNTPERRAFARRLATILRAHGVEVWWDYGLAEGESYRQQITDELAKARVVIPLWCAESIHSKWVAMEAELGKDKLLPVRLQNIAPPDAFEAIHAADLVGWDGTISHPRLQAFVRRLCERLGKPGTAPADTLEELAQLPPLAVLPMVTLKAGPTVTAPQSGPGRVPWPWIGATAGGVLGLAWLAAYLAGMPVGGPAGRPTVELAAPDARLGRPVEPVAKTTVTTNIAATTARDRVAALTPGAGKTEFARDTLADGTPCGFCPEMVVVPKGDFMMGSSQAQIFALSKEVPSAADHFKWEGPQHKVTIAQPFAVGRFAVTFDEWEACVADGGCKARPGDQGWGRGNRPVINVSWTEVTGEYLPWLSKKTGRSYRLLSEAEREYAAKAGTKTAYWWGQSISTDQANYDGSIVLDGSSKGPNRQTTEPVDSFQPNPWGLYQVHGNVYDWTADCWHDTYNGAPADGSAWTEGCSQSGLRVLRGGARGLDPRSIRAAYRYSKPADGRFSFTGFRVARSVSSLAALP
jgi:formylglycine-generating enzyme required for sulfatase activity